MDARKSGHHGEHQPRDQRAYPARLAGYPGRGGGTEGGAIVTTLLCRTHDVFDKLYNDYREQHGGRKPNPDKTVELWNDASDIAEREQAQTLINREAAQRLMLGMAIDTAYAPLLAPQQSHEAAIGTALADAARAAHSAQEAQR